MPTILANGIKQNYELMLPAPLAATVPLAAPVPTSLPLPPSRAGSDGPPPTIVCVHGILIDSLASYYFTLAKALRDAGFRVVMYDLRGHGNTERPTSGYRLDDFVDDLAALLDALDITEPVYLMGNSFGGTVAYAFAERHPHRTAGVTAIESEPATEQWSVKLADHLHRAATQLGTFEATLWLTATFGRHLVRRAKRAKKTLDATTLEHDLPDSRVLTPEQIAAIGCPVLALYGSKSDLAAQAPVLEALMPRCTAKVLPGLEHSVLVEVPRTVLDLLLSWIDEDRLVRTEAGAQPG